MFGFRKWKVNKVVMSMVYADFLFFTAAGFISPIIAVFYTEQIEGGTLAVAGIAATVFWLVKSAIQVPVSLYADKNKGERDDYALMMTGFVIAGIVPLLYYFIATQVWHVYLLEAIKGVRFALLTPTYLAIFTRHIDRQKESTEWTLHSNAVGLGYAAAAAVGGILAEQFGFRVLFILVAVVTWIAPLTLIGVRGELRRGKGKDIALEFERQKQIIHH